MLHVFIPLVDFVTLVRSDHVPIYAIKAYVEVEVEVFPFILSPDTRWKYQLHMLATSSSREKEYKTGLTPELILVPWRREKFFYLCL
jgi:hypothetical protein